MFSRLKTECLQQFINKDVHRLKSPCADLPTLTEDS